MSKAKIVIDCNGCYAPCCRIVNYHPVLKEFDRGDGVCKNLKDDSSCGIYENRPEACNADRIKRNSYPDMKENDFKKQCDIGCLFADKVFHLINKDSTNKMPDKRESE